MRCGYNGGRSRHQCGRDTQRLHGGQVTLRDQLASALAPYEDVDCCYRLPDLQIRHCTVSSVSCPG